MKSSSRIIWLPIALAASALVWRVLKHGGVATDWLPNFSPWMALSFAGGALMPKHLPGWIWGVALVVIDCCFAGAGDFAQMWTVFGCYILAGLMGSALRQRCSVMDVITGTLGSGALFYLVTNTQAWWMSAAYTKNFEGWVQALTIGDPRYQPQTWVFGVSSMASDLVFAMLLVLAFNYEALRRNLGAISFTGRTAVA